MRKKVWEEGEGEQSLIGVISNGRRVSLAMEKLVAWGLLRTMGILMAKLYV